MRQLVILKTGGTLPELAAARGDFEDWTAAGLGAALDYMTGLGLDAIAIDRHAHGIADD